MVTEVSFQKDRLSEIESLPYISSVELIDKEEEEYLKIIPNQSTSQTTIDQITSLLKSIVPNYLETDDPSDITIGIHHNTTTDNYCVFAIPHHESHTTPNSDSNIDIDTIGEQTSSDSEYSNIELEEDKSETDDTLNDHDKDSNEDSTE